MRQRVLVLGAGGFVGRRVTEALATTDWAWPVAGYRRLPADGRMIEQLRLDATSLPQLQRALPGIDAVVNCVAGSRAVIVGSARALFQAAGAQPRPPRIVHLSSMSVYGVATGLTDELGELNDELGRYSSAKIEAERLAAGYPAVVTLRPSCVFGPESAQWSERIARWLQAHRIGDLGSAGDGFANLIYIDDLVTAILAALRTPGIEGQAFNLSIPDPPTWNEYFLRYAVELGAVPIRRISRRRLRLESLLLAPPLQVAELVLRALGIVRSRLPAPIPPSLLGLWRKEVLVDGRRAQKVMRLEWTPLDQALRTTADWFNAMPGRPQPQLR